MCIYKFMVSIFTGETDWKVLVINVEDPIAPEVNGKLIITIEVVNYFSLNYS